MFTFEQFSFKYKYYILNVSIGLQNKPYDSAIFLSQTESEPLSHDRSE